MEEIIVHPEPKNLVLGQQAGVALAAICTLTIAGLRIYKTLKGDANPVLELVTNEE